MLYILISFAMPMVWAVMTALFPLFMENLRSLNPVITIVSMGFALYGFVVMRTEGLNFKKARLAEIILIVINLTSITMNKNASAESVIASHGTFFVFIAISQMAVTWYVKFLTGQAVREMERHRNVDIDGKVLEKVILIEIALLTFGYIFLHIYAPIGLILSILALVANAVAVYCLYKTYKLSREVPGIK